MKNAAVKLDGEQPSAPPAERIRQLRRQARTLCAAEPDAGRLAFAQAFCGAAITTFWQAHQAAWPNPWPIAARPKGTSAARLRRPAKALAAEIGGLAAECDVIEAAFHLGGVYTATMPRQTRAKLGVFYTPPALVDRLIAQASSAGIDWRTCRVLDPACGGGAFLAPVARLMAGALTGTPADRLVRDVAGRLQGFEIDPFAAWMSQVFVECALLPLCRAADLRFPTVVKVCDALDEPPGDDLYDLVVANPPYGRLSLTPARRERFRRGLFGHANIYGLFKDKALTQAKDGGTVAFVTPASFLGGRYFERLRRLIAAEAPPYSIDLIGERKGVFDDVQQETLLAVYRRGASRGTAAVTFVERGKDGSLRIRPVGGFDLPEKPGDPWLLPRTPRQADLIANLRRMPHRLADYGYRVSTGPLVWNRYKGQLKTRRNGRCYPLIWAESVRSDSGFEFRADRRNHKPYFEVRDDQDWLTVKSACVLVQRTTAKEQQRRLIAAELPAAFIEQHGAVVVENHLNMIRPANGPSNDKSSVTSKTIEAILNSDLIDQAYRCISGSVAVSAFELAALPLPGPDDMAALERLVLDGAGRDRIEAELDRIYFRHE